MKRLFTSVLSFLMAFSLWAEAPQTISYQAVVRNGEGRLIRGKSIGVRIIIVQGNEIGNSVYTETRKVTTNVNGLMTFAIGDASAITSDKLSNIAWADNNYFLRCDIDLDGGENYTLSSTSQMNSVPYALYAKNIAPEALPAWAQSEDKPVYNYSEIQDAPEVPSKVSELENDANYITINELPKADSLLSKAEASITYQPKGNYLTEHQSLEAYAKKTEIPTVPINVSSFTNDAGYLTEHQSLADYAKKSELPKADSLLSKVEASTTYQPKGEYLTEHQSLADYAKKSELPSTAGLLSEAKAAETYQPKGEYLTEHQSLTDYAKKSELPSVPTNVSSFTNDAGYLTEHQSLADYAKKSDLPKKDSLLSKAEASTTYQPKGSYLTEHQSLVGYATKSELPKADSLLSKAEASTTYQPKGNYLTEHQSLADYAKKSDLPKKDSLLSKAEASTTYQPKGNYLTEHQSLADYAKKTDLPSVPTKVSELTNDAGYVTESSINTTLNTINVSELVNDAEYVKKEELPTVPTKVSELTNDKGYLTEHQSLADYAKKTDLPSVPTKVSELTNDAGYVTESSINTTLNTINVSELVNDAEYVKKEELPTVPTKVSELTNDKGYLTEHQSLADYAKKTDLPSVPTKVSELTNDAGYITATDIPKVQVPSLTDYAKKSELPSTEGLLSETKAAEIYQPKGEYLTEHQSLADYAKKSDLPKKDSLLSKAEASTTYQPKGNYLTEHQSLADYAKKTEIPTVPTKVSSFTNDAGYLTEHQSLAAYAKKTDIPTKVSSFVNDKNYITASDIPEVVIPTKISDLENDTKFITKSDIPTKVSSFVNDKNYITASDIPEVVIPTKISDLENDTKFITKSDIPTKVSSFINDSKYITKTRFDIVVDSLASIINNYKNLLDSVVTELQKGGLSIGNNNEYEEGATLPSETIKIENGVLPHNFTVSSTGKQINFSQGNLLYRASSNTYKFAEHQYDIVGINNDMKSSYNPNWIDIFEWEDATKTYDQIENGGSIKWRALSEAEWTHLIKGRNNASNLRFGATVNGIAGYVFLPDDWNFPNWCTYDSKVSSKENIITKEKWNAMESIGAVFFPCGGFLLQDYGEIGLYWCSDNVEDKSTSLYPCISFNSNTSGSDLLNHATKVRLSSYTTMRLVKDISFQFKPSSSEGGSVNGSGYYGSGTVVTVTATPDEGYYFKQWSDGIFNPTRKFDISKDSSIFAIFEKFEEKETEIINGGFTKLFSVSENKQVTFSQGNLQYQASTNTWRFAKNQYDVIGEDNSMISATNEGWIDLFGWATSGWEDGIKAYKPYSTNNLSSDYDIKGVMTNEMTGIYSKADWGINNAISNGGDLPNLWRTLTDSEWDYLFRRRKNADKLRTEAMVENVCGVLLFPDDWIVPTGLAVVRNATSYQTNKYTILEWNILESSGAVFLPAAGKRDGSKISNINTDGAYWSSTPINSNAKTFSVGSDNYTIGGTSSANKNYGLSVRLVKLQPCTLKISSSPVDAGYIKEINNVGIYEKGTTVTLTAIAKPGYFFDQWSDGDKSPVRKISFESDIHLTAQFISLESVIEEGLIPGHFSVGKEKTVKFSRGNLQYQASSDTWRFAEHQYDIISGENKNISNTYEGWIDLFGWATSGWENKPYSSSISVFQYYINNDASISMVDDYANADWGVFNAISNGGNEIGKWRVLSNSEWTYLYSGRSNASKLRTKATIAGIQGLVFFPDSWVTPEEIKVVMDATSYTVNNYSSSDWSVLENMGAVFLPAAGRRSGKSVSSVGSYGYYWSSSYYNNNDAYMFYFYGSYLGYSRDSRYYGQSVRLVQE